MFFILLIICLSVFFASLFGIIYFAQTNCFSEKYTILFSFILVLTVFLIGSGIAFVIFLCSYCDNGKIEALPQKHKKSSEQLSEEIIRNSEKILENEEKKIANELISEFKKNKKELSDRFENHKKEKNHGQIDK